jgi:hypothetical protein
MVLLQQQANHIRTHHSTNNARIVMFDSSNEPSRCNLLGYLMRRNRNGWSVCESINRMYYYIHNENKWTTFTLPQNEFSPEGTAL